MDKRFLKMEKGDYIICKKDFVIGHHRHFKKNEKYKIEHITKFEDIIYTAVTFLQNMSPSKYIYEYTIKGEHFSENFISEYFYTKQEERKIKLVKLNESCTTG